MREKKRIIFTICGAGFDSMRSVEEAYRQLSYKDRRVVLLTALGWMDNELVADCIAGAEADLWATGDKSCGATLVMFALNRMIGSMESQRVRSVGDYALGVRLPFEQERKGYLREE